MNDRTLKMLRSLQHGPRTMRDFTHCTALFQNAAAAYLSELMDKGYVEAAGSRNERRYAITYSGELALANQPEVASSRYLCNAAMTSVYVPPAWTSARPGADDHRQYGSRGDRT